MAATGMAQRELESQLKTFIKVVGDKDSAPAAIAILETLKKDVKPTEELLRVRSVVCQTHSRSAHVIF